MPSLDCLVNVSINMVLGVVETIFHAYTYVYIIYCTFGPINRLWKWLIFFSSTTDTLSYIEPLWSLLKIQCNLVTYKACEFCGHALGLLGQHSHHCLSENTCSILCREKCLVVTIRLHLHRHWCWAIHWTLLQHLYSHHNQGE